MENRVSTIIIEPRLVLREALELLMGNHSYHVICGVGSIEQISPSSAGPDGPALVVLGEQSAASATKAAAALRRLWPASKIILLFDNASPSDFNELLASEIDGCIPLFVSPDTMISTLGLIVSRTIRVMVMGGMNAPDGARQSSGSPESGLSGKPASNGGSHAGMAILNGHVAPLSTTAEASVADMRSRHPSALTDAPRLSDREAQILDGLVKGYPNKVIARRCEITEATVKVHMKSILRKIRVGNRTQAAIWALEHDYCLEGGGGPAEKNVAAENVFDGSTPAAGENRLSNVQE
jgi:two-component system nitrate/nitrite response regulator NarL